MKHLIILVLAAVFTTATFAQTQTKTKHKTEHKTTKHKTKTKPVYSCPMHPEVTTNKPGKCSECGMKLVVNRVGSKQTRVAYTCPMHPEVKGTSTDKCPKCGMALEPKKAAGTGSKMKM